MQENTLKALITKRIYEISQLKGLSLTEEQYKIWVNKIIKDYNENRIIDIEKGFNKLESEKCYGGLDYAIFYSGASLNNSVKVETAWENVLASARSGGIKTIDARSAKALNSFGGLIVVMDSTSEDLHWVRDRFIEAYEMYPNSELIEINFSCRGLEAPIVNSYEQKQIVESKYKNIKNYKQAQIKSEGIKKVSDILSGVDI